MDIDVLGTKKRHLNGIEHLNLNAGYVISPARILRKKSAKNGHGNRVTHQGSGDDCDSITSDERTDESCASATAGVRIFETLGIRSTNSLDTCPWNIVVHDFRGSTDIPLYQPDSLVVRRVWDLGYACRPQLIL
jgi:hypothetical protein